MFHVKLKSKRTVNLLKLNIYICNFNSIKSIHLKILNWKLFYILQLEFS